MDRPTLLRPVWRFTGYVFAHVALGASLTGLDVPGSVADPIPLRTYQVEDLIGWAVRTNSRVLSWESPQCFPGFEWNEAVPSWNTAPGSAWTIELRAIRGTGAGRWYSLGHWCSQTNRAPRTSLGTQANGEGRVLTDTLQLSQAATGLQIRLTAGAETSAVDFRHFAVSLIDTRQSWSEPESDRSVWGRELAVPVLSQADFPQGVSSWCSPTSVGMLLAWWSRERGWPEKTPSIPEVAAGVYDPGWPGTGNWAFNMAYVGQTDGLRALTVRLAGVVDLERWIQAGYPVGASVSYSLLKGRSQAEAGDGHLVVVRGFSATGDVLINDPGVRASRVQKTILRAHFIRAWKNSNRTAYLIWPITQSLPEGGKARW